MSRRTVLLSVVGLVVAALVAGGIGWYVTRAADSEASGPDAPDLTRFYAQEPKWTDCEGGECTTVTVPIDYEKPDDGTAELQVKVFPATGEGGKRLFINPGGPGGSVIGGFDEYMADTLGKKVRKQYDVVAVDPRGVGSSEPVDCLSDDELTQIYADDQTPDDEAEYSKLDSQWKNFGDRCRERSGDLAGHMTTEETARDFDIVRAALKAKTFDWFGYSYGARLGATYATLFPARVGRMVLDGADDPSMGPDESLPIQGKGFEVGLRSFVDDCVAKKSCPLGRQPEAAIQKISSLLESLDSKPMPTDDEKRPLTESLAFLGLIYPLYDQASWPELEKALTAALEDDDGAPLLALADGYLYRLEDGSFGDNIMEAYPVVSCLDWDDRITAKEAPAQAERFAEISPVFGRSLAAELSYCVGLPESDHARVDVDARKSAPIVVIGTTRDPATPYEQSIKMAQQLGSAVHVTREGDGHTAYGMGNDCIDDLVDAYLAEGTVPKDKTVCGE